jgi:hypothetical protein
MASSLDGAVDLHCTAVALCGAIAPNFIALSLCCNQTLKQCTTEFLEDGAD